MTDLAATVAGRHYADTKAGGVHRGPLPDESLTYSCAECGMDWPCDAITLANALRDLHGVEHDHAGHSAYDCPTPGCGPALVAEMEREGVVTWADDGHRERFMSDEEVAARSVATPAPLDVDPIRLQRAMEAVFAAGSDIELQNVAKPHPKYAERVARAYEENTDD